MSRDIMSRRYDELLGHPLDRGQGLPAANRRTSGVPADFSMID
jgi:hypothetical protein